MHLDASGPILLFGGPYSNLAATRAMIAEAERLGIAPERTFCTGDVVAYAAEPEETTALVRQWGCHVIAGNCEEQLASAAEDCGCGFEEGTVCSVLSKGWYPYANARVSPESRAWMRALPATLRFTFGGKRFRLVHGGVTVVNRFVFASDTAALAAEFASADADIVVAGHAGLPFISRIGPGVWFNAGVVGLPANDGTVDVWYGLANIVDDKLVLSTHRLAYDHQSAAAAMRRSGHANPYARAIVTGVWPSHDVLPPAELAVTGKRLRPRSLSLPLKAGVRGEAVALAR